MGAPNKQWVEDSRLWLVLDSQAAAPRTLPEVTRLSIQGGVSAVLCRLKDLPAADCAGISKDVRQVCTELAVPFVMSHDTDLALRLLADGIQLGITDPPLPVIRKRVGDDLVIGCSTHSVAEARLRFEEGADYVFLGPIFPTPEKLRYGPPLGVAAVQSSTLITGPVIFIGGISETNVDEIISAGGRRIAAISALQRCADPVFSASILRSHLP